MYYSTDSNSEKLTNTFIQDAHKKFGTKRITILVDSVLTNSSTQTFFMQRIVNMFPTSIVNTTLLWSKLPEISPEIKLRRVLSRADENENLNVIFITNIETRSTLNKLTIYMNTIVKSTFTFKRSKYLIFLSNLNKSMQLHVFF